MGIIDIISTIIIGGAAALIIDHKIEKRKEELERKSQNK